MSPEPASGAPLVEIAHVSKNYGPVRAVEDVSVTIAPGEFFALLGPSGCGKTTLMRLVAGFETPDSGRIAIAGEDMAQVPPHRRPVNMMFQSYALFPHLDVARNIGFGLVQAGLARDKIAARVAEMMRLVRLEGLERRKPDQLSGGQRQRVALARALARGPKLLLLDEPLAALDRKLREETQFELMRLQREVGTSFILVTHDQDEAMIMASRIAVMRDGRIEQVGTPRDIYDRPQTRFVADFVGAINLIEATIEAVADGRIAARDGEGVLFLPEDDGQGARAGERVTLAIRPERVTLTSEADALFRARIVESAFRGETLTLRLARGSGEMLRVSCPPQTCVPEPGSSVGLAVAPEAFRVLRR